MFCWFCSSALFVSDFSEELFLDCELAIALFFWASSLSDVLMSALLIC